MNQSFGDETDNPTREVAEDAIDHPSTGHPRIDEALTRLDALDDLEITQHPEEYDAIHRVLRESLAGAGHNGDAPDVP